MKKILISFLLISSSLSFMALPVLAASPMAGKKAAVKELKKEAKEVRKIAKAKKDETKLDKQKTSLMNRVVNKIEQWQRMKDRVINMPNVDQAMKDNVSKAVDEAVAKLSDFKNKINDAKTLAEVKGLVKTFNDLAKTHQGLVKTVVDAVHNSAVVNKVTDAKNRITALDAKVQLVKDAVKKTDLQKMLDSAKDQVNQAQTAVDKKDFEGVVAHLKEANSLFKKIVEGLKAV